MDPSALGGALIALSGAFVLQSIVVPWVDAKKRREQRWEDDVHALGELMTFDLRRAVDALTHELSVLAILQATDERIRPGWIELTTAPQASVKVAAAELAGVRVRLDWLRGRVGALAPDNSQSKDFVSRSRLLSVQLIGLTTLEWKAEPRPDVDERLTTEEVDEARHRIEESIGTVLSAVTTFGTSRPLRTSPRARVSRLVQGLRRG
ncbi:hypothetical protein OH802_04180 [Nocardioides sp. NBC_00850]|uniref:hypothetical protein n=1 Tax=Nocardioides sp. NBC_00850 TaxID=2976001 RepID=UPI00386811C7|nr:hypothetical protein OH802_04180 [Nocardioides sp. NBC_00850]